MRLFLKLALALSLVLAFLAGMTAFVLQTTLMSGFQEIEDRVARQHIESVVKTIHNQENALRALAADHGSWDETWEFVQGRNPTFTQEQIGYSTFVGLGVDAAYFFDADGNYIWGEVPDASLKEDFDVSVLPELVSPRDFDEPELAWQSGGFVRSRRGLVMVGAAPILHNDDTGPSVGVVVFAKLIDAEFLDDVREQTTFEPEFLPLGASSSCGEKELSPESETNASDFTTCIESKTHLSGKALMRDPQGSPVALLSVEMPRDISETGRSGLQVALVLLGIASLVAIVTAGIALQRIVIAPIAVLSNTMRTVEGTGKLSTRSNLSSKDEIGAMSRNLDAMLDSLYTVRQELNAARLVAEKANRAKSEFLAMMSHEIRTPLNGVIGMTEVMQQSGLTERQLSMADVIETSGRNLLEILNNILDLSKLEAGHTELYDQAGDVVDVIETSLRPMKHGTTGPTVVIRSQIEPGVPTSFTCDVGKLQQILRNYLGNAQKFTLEGEILVRVFMKKSEGAGDDIICFRVEDTGIGIAPETIPRLFNRFVQADNSTSRKFGGTGLGLAICKELAALMGGKVGCDSEIDKGSKFWIELPARDMEYEAGYLNENQA